MVVISDYLLPGSIIFLKFGLRMTTDQETNRVDTLKAILVFPVDIAFLSLTYGSTILYAARPEAIASLTIKGVLAAVIATIALLIPVIVISKKSERAFVLAKTKKASTLCAFGYLFALSLTAISVAVGSEFR